MIDRNTAWFIRVMALALLIGLGQVLMPEIGRVIVMTIAGVFIFQSLVDSRRITDRHVRSFIRLLLGELALMSTWLALNIVRVYNYEAAVEGPDSTGRTAYWFAVEVQPYLTWIAIAVLVVFLILLISRLLHSRKTNGLNANNV